MGALIDAKGHRVVFGVNSENAAIILAALENQAQSGPLNITEPVSPKTVTEIVK